LARKIVAAVNSRGKGSLARCGGMTANGRNYHSAKKIIVYKE
jgi:hypothetical protein